MDMPIFDEMAQSVTAECQAAENEINVHSAEWQAIRRYLNARKWQIAASILRGGPPEAVEQARGKAAILSELLNIRGQTSAEG